MALLLASAWRRVLTCAWLIPALAATAGSPLLFAGDEPLERDPREYFFTPSFGDLPEELEEARQAGKIGMLLFFEQEGCPLCQRMMRTVLNQPRVQDWYAERFVSIAVDINGAVELRDFDGITLPSKIFAAHRKVKTTPVMSFIDQHGAEVFRRSTVVDTPEEFLLMGEYVAGGHYTDTPWREYLKEHTQADDQLATLPMISDFLEAGRRAANRRVPLLLAVTRTGCAYCARLRRDVLAPMRRSGEYDDRVMIGEMMMDPDAPVIDFSGAPSSTAALAGRYDIEITPTVLLLDGSGRLLTKPIIGINNAEMYGFYLDAAIDLAAAAMAAPDPAEEGESP